MQIHFDTYSAKDTDKIVANASGVNAQHAHLEPSGELSEESATD